ncbi:MAG TPA: peptidoglycan-binding protein [Solirubrobacteraceae bacterium]|nr:peptidoglycan-binding protein [Solirubrobacteraceae bacterium]
MSGSPRDLALVDPWEVSLQRSLARRARAGGRMRAGAARTTTLSTLLSAASHERDLSSAQLWELSLGRSRARRRAAELRFVPGSSRAKRMSLGALAALSVAPIASLAEAGSGGGGALASAATVDQPATTAARSVVLESGNEGRSVRQLQRALGGVTVDGVFGPETEQAVRSFQAAKGLSVDGVVGPQTVAALRQLVATKTSFSSFHPAIPGDTAGVASSAAQPSVSGTRVDAALVTSEGSGATGEDGATGSTSQPAATGGAAASAASDSEPGLLEEPSSTGGSSAGATGEPSAVAQEEAKAAAEEAAERQTQQRERDAVQRLQAALHVTPDGEFGPETEAAIIRLQARHGLAVDGIAGPATWKVIGVHDEATLTPPPSAIPQPEATGEEQAQAGVGGAASAADEGGSSTIKRLQIALHLSPDGEFGPETEAAVQRLQTRHGLTPDGIVGPATWSVIGVSDAGELSPPPSAIVHEAPAEPATPAEPVGVVSEPVAEGGGSSGDVGDDEVREAPPSAGDVGSGDVGSGGGEVSDEETSGGGDVVSRVIAAGNEIATRPYVYGGGHGSFQSEGYDCSGSVSYALHGGGLISSPEDSTELESYGDAGPGKHITIYANSEHAFMVVDGKRFDTVAQAETGTRWSNSMTSTAGFVVRHPPGQ